MAARAKDLDCLRAAAGERIQNARMQALLDRDEGGDGS
jgi:hypothetical protein